MPREFHSDLVMLKKICIDLDVDCDAIGAQSRRSVKLFYGNECGI